MPELGGGGGGEIIWAMPERNRFFLWEVFPNIDDDNGHGDDDDDDDVDDSNGHGHDDDDKMSPTGVSKAKGVCELDHRRSC